MTKKEFAEKVAEIVGGKVTEVEKANGIVLLGIIVGEGEGIIRPTVYIDQMYEDGLDIESCASTIRDMAERSMIAMPDISRINDFNTVKGDIRLRLYSNTTHAEICKSASAYGFDDMILVPYLDNVIPNGSVKISASLMEVWGVSEEEIFEEAARAGKYEILSLNYIMEELAHTAGKEFTIDECCPMFVVTNPQRCYGAYGVIALKDRLNEMFPSGFTVIPSSVHECIVIPKDSADIETVSSMVREVNKSCVSPEEVLGNHAYEF